MAQSVKNGKNGNTARVDKAERLHTFTVTRSEVEQSTIDGKAYNINTGLITLTSDGESALLYYKHNDSQEWDIDSIIVIMGPSTDGSALDTVHVRSYKNPSIGTLVSNAVPADIVSNRDFTSADPLSADVFKGVDGDTITDGVIHLESLIPANGREPFPISETLRKGNSIAVSLEPPAGNTNMKVMVAMIGHLSVDTKD
jgi:hypothetical protein